MIWLSAIHLGATLCMTGLIWLVQLVHYPLFSKVGAEQFPLYESLHRRRITFLVGPLMLAEAVTSVVLLVASSPVPVWARWLGAGLVVCNAAVTAFISVPLHQRLSIVFEQNIHRQLVMTNWLRTSAWTIRGALAIWFHTLISQN